MIILLITTIFSNWNGIVLNVKAAIIGSGTCGDSVYWSFADDGTLIISGSGEMDNTGTEYDGDWPWDR